jgi:hypothetical protein
MVNIGDVSYRYFIFVRHKPTACTTTDRLIYNMDPQISCSSAANNTGDPLKSNVPRLMTAWNLIIETQSVTFARKSHFVS